MVQIKHPSNTSEHNHLQLPSPAGFPLCFTFLFMMLFMSPPPPKALTFPSDNPAQPLEDNDVPNWIYFAAPFLLLFSAVLCFYHFFSPSFSYNMSVSQWAFHCGALGSRFLLNCSITVRVLLYILSRQTVQLVTQYIINTLWCCLYFHPQKKKYNHKYLKVIFQWCEALLDRCNYMLPGLSPLASLWLQSPLATQYTHSAARSED